MTLIDPFAIAVTIPLCAQDATSDYEAELCVVIGKIGRDISEGKALEHVLGYTTPNDIPARTLQLSAKQWSLPKRLDSSFPIGMCFCIAPRDRIMVRIETDTAPR